MTARDQLAPQRDRRELLPRIAEGGEQETARPGQTNSATVRSTRDRPSAVKSIGLNISVPTPASR